MSKIILIPPCYTYGDTLSIVSLAYFLLNYYENVLLGILGEGDVFYHNEGLYIFYDIFF